MASPNRPRIPEARVARHRPQSGLDLGITKLLGPAKWNYFYLYVIVDFFSRYVVGWMIGLSRLRRRSC
jgi:putative transposase